MAKVMSKYGLRPDLDTKTGLVTIQLIVRETKEVVDERKFEPRKLPGAIQDQLLLAGTSTTLQQRVSQADPFDKLDGMDKVWELAWLEGKWELPREPVVRVKAADRPLLEVLAEAKSVQLKRKVYAHQLEASWLAYSEEQQQALREKYAERLAAKDLAPAAGPRDLDLDDL